MEIAKKELKIKPMVASGQKLYVETYGCQMNVNDTEVVVSIMQDNGFVYTEDAATAEVILINTCSIRDNAEQRIWGRLKEFAGLKKRNNALIVGVIGCMAERLKEQLIEQDRLVDVVVGPDAYRSLPDLVRSAGAGQKAVNVLLSREETYAEISPVRLDKNGVTGFVSIMRGCNNMCSYCVVPYTRGSERSRNPHTILNEVKELIAKGYKEVTLLGQNVNSYLFENPSPTDQTDSAEKNETVSTQKETINFARLMELVAELSPELRVRFATSHPKDLSDELLDVMVKHRNICKSIHLPAQSGSSRMLEVMNRKYNRSWYLDRIAAIKTRMPECSISTDIIAGFCTETLEDHQQTLSLMETVGYEFAYMFKYSERPNTKAARTMTDDVSDAEKTRRLTEIINLQNQLSLAGNQRDVGKTFEVLVEGVSKRSDNQLFGRTSQNKVVVFPRLSFKVGDYVQVKVESCSSATLIGTSL